MKKAQMFVLAFFILFILTVFRQLPATDSVDSSSEISYETGAPDTETLEKSSEIMFSADDVIPYSNQPYAVVNDNIPYFSESDLTTEPFERYSDLDDLGRCGTACANICIDIMPTEERGEIGQIKPSGWHTVKYNDIIDGNYLYNRCHLIGYQLAGENANVQNLITGTRYLNVQGMLPFENQVADYVTKTGNHVLYRVTPVFEGENLVASGVLMEAKSVEDNGEGIQFCVYVYNVQPGIAIDYLTGESSLIADCPDTPYGTELPKPENPEPEPQGITYILNTNTGKFHYPYCSGVEEIKERNKQEYTGNREDVMAQGYEPCKICNP